jgi:hypothetical protein
MRSGDPRDPAEAREVVVEYARVLERHLAEEQLPAPLEALPYAKGVIREAIRTSVLSLSGSGQLTDQLREFLETAYISLADYVDKDLVRLLKEYREAGAELAADTRSAREKTAMPAWQRIAESSAIAGKIARSISEDADQLRQEFRGFIA